METQLATKVFFWTRFATVQSALYEKRTAKWMIVQEISLAITSEVDFINRKVD